MTQPIVPERRPIPDPNISIGEHYRILERRDGRYIALDDRLPPGQVAVIEETKAAAVASANALLKAGCPLVAAIEPPPRGADGRPSRARKRTY